MPDPPSNSSQSTPHPERCEIRAVTVHEPDLSLAANQLLTDDLREVIGATRARVPADRPHAERGEGEDPRRSAVRAEILGNRFILWQVTAALLVVCVIVALVFTNGWWLLPAAITVLGLGTFTVVRMVLGMTAVPERPSPGTIARLEEEGIANPEELFSDLVAEFTEDTAAHGTDQRTVAVEDDPTAATAEQRSATTPTGGPSRPVGPDPN